MPPVARRMAVLIATVAIAALVAQGIVSSRLMSMPGALQVIWAMVGYFTVLVNLVVAATFARIAWAGRSGTAVWHGAVLLWIATVGLIYHTLLAGIWAPQGLAWWADQGLHTATPALVVIWWLAFAPKAPLDLRHPWLWSVLPLVYCGYALLRGQISGVYAYPFIDMATIGPQRTGLNVAGLTLGFVLGGYAVVAIARALAHKARVP